MVDNNQENLTQELISAAIFGIQEKKGIDIDLMSFKSIPNSVSDYFIICQGSSNTQVEAIADSVSESVRKKTGNKPWHIEGKENAEWILIDYINVVVHVFVETARSFYNLEKLWGDADIRRIEE
jgi:ribosome-associated protein